MLKTQVAKLGIGNARACPDGAVAHSCCSEHEGRIPRNHRPARKDGKPKGRDRRSKEILIQKSVRGYVSLEFSFSLNSFSLGLWFCSEYFVVPTTKLARHIVGRGEAFLMMELPRRHATSLSGSRLAPITIVISRG